MDSLWFNKIELELSDGNRPDSRHSALYREDDATTGDPYNSHDLPKEPLSLIWIPICGGCMTAAHHSREHESQVENSVIPGSGGQLYQEQ